MKVFNTTGPCIPAKHYMVDLSSRMVQIKAMVDAGQYFVINRARQYGKTTTLSMLAKYLKNDYIVLNLDFQGFSSATFATEGAFVSTLIKKIIRANDRNTIAIPQEIYQLFEDLGKEEKNRIFLDKLFRIFSFWCRDTTRPIVLMIDEVDSNMNQVFFDFLAQLRSKYIHRDPAPAFQSVILVGVTDIKNFCPKIQPGGVQRCNSPWNIASDFNIDMSFNARDIAGMLEEYEADHHTGMDIEACASIIHDYTSGYPFLVSRICKLLDEAPLLSWDRLARLSVVFCQKEVHYLTP